MYNEKPDDDVQYVVTCTFCGTQTRLSLQQVESNEPLKCRLCGAPLEIVPPPTRPAKKRKKRSSDYYLLHAERAENEPPDKKYNLAVNVVVIFFYASVVIAFILMWLIAKC